MKTLAAVGEPWRRATGESLKPFSETLAGLPSTLQERLFARMQLLFPLLVITLSFFWIASGLIGFWRHAAAVDLVSDALGEPLASFSVYAASMLDLLIGFGLLIRKSFHPACLAAVAVSLGYLAIGSYVAPELWGDPLGPLIKVFPSIALALVLAAMAEER